MKTAQINRWTKLCLKTKTLKNRVVVPPMASQTADINGFVTEKTLQHYQRLTDSHAALIIVEYTYVHLTGRSEENQLGISNDTQLEGLKRLALLIKSSGTLAGIQLSHGGAKSERNLTGGVLMGPSAIAVPVKDQLMEIPAPMNQEDIELWITAFIKAADRAVAAGFDLIEIHAAHGYGLNQWLSPITNQRNDINGSQLKGRMRLLLEIIKSIRTKHPDLLISVRIPGQDFLENGLQVSDSIYIAQSLEQSGVDVIHVSSGIGGWRRPGTRNGEGYLVNEARQIQAKVGIPVIGVGGITSGKYIDEGLTTGQFSLVSVGRAILKDPKAWYELTIKD